MIQTGEVRDRRIYMAGPLFTLAERTHNLSLCTALQNALPSFTLVLPQLRAEAFNGDLKSIANDCFSQVKLCDAVIACVDGPDTDSGTAIEIGYAVALEKPVIGYRTDFRVSEADGLNAMVRYSCARVILMKSYDVDMTELAGAIARELSDPQCYLVSDEVTT